MKNIAIDAGDTDVRPDKNEAGETCRRYWFAKCQYPGKESFLYGNVEGEQEMTAEQALLLIEKMLDKNFPTRPEILKMIGGRIYIMLDKAETI